MNGENEKDESQENYQMKNETKNEKDENQENNKMKKIKLGEL